jgi:hypothetical protein
VFNSTCSTPPGAQATYERWSLVFFTRPGDSVILQAVAKAPENQFNTGSTSLEWFSRRIKNQRIANRTVRSFRSIARLCTYARIFRVQRRIALVEGPSGNLIWFNEDARRLLCCVVQFVLFFSPIVGCTWIMTAQFSSAESVERVARID